MTELKTDQHSEQRRASHLGALWEPAQPPRAPAGGARCPSAGRGLLCSLHLTKESARRGVQITEGAIRLFQPNRLSFL